MSNVVVRTTFMDNSVKAFAIQADETVQEFRAKICEKLDLSVHDTFALFEKKDDWERCLDPDEKPSEIQKQWEQDKKSKTTSKFLFKKKIFLKDDERELADPIAKDLVYIQAVHDVIESVYNVDGEDALRLAGLQVQVVYGDHNPTTHIPGFLTNNKDIVNFVPKDLMHARKPQAWEEAILKEHAKRRQMEPDDAREEYINICKGFLLYGMTFFPPCRATSKTLPSRVLLGVNFEGIHIMKVKDKAVISDHLYTDICSWASSSTSFGFEFGNQTESTKYNFDTKMGSIIAATVQTYIDILVHMLKNEDED